MLPARYGFTQQLAAFDTDAASGVRSVATIMLANSALQTALAPYSPSGNAVDVANIGLSLQVIAASADDIWLTENGQTPSGTVGHEILKGAGVFYFRSAELVKYIGKAGTPTVKLGYWLAS